MLRWKQIDKDFISVDVGKVYNEKPFYWTTFYYYKGLIIDTGCPHCAEETTRFLKTLGFDIKAILLTHFHEDHSGAAYLIQERLDTDVFAPRKSIEILANPLIIPMYRQKVWGQPKPVRAKPLRKKMQFGKNKILTLDTPGHSFDHVSFLIDDKFFIGDLVTNLSPIIIMKQEDYIDLINSLRTILKLDFETAYGGHGVWGKESIREALNNILKLKKKIEVLHSKGLGASQIVEELFPDVPEKVLMMEELSEFEWSRKNLIESLLDRMHR
jgi:glyoxylase-like metal-dependent hydrolase (beta-lactamase superfamily II)